MAVLHTNIENKAGVQAMFKAGLVPPGPALGRWEASMVQSVSVYSLH